MLTLSITLNLLLTSFIVYQFSRQVSTAKQLESIQEKMTDILSGDSRERLLLTTNNKAIIALLEKVNHLLDKYFEVLRTTHRKEKSVKIMLTNVSHDLKTPLTTVLGYAEIVSSQNNIEPSERQRLLGKVHEKTLQSLTLINRFFDFARLESGDHNIPLQYTPVNDICRKSILDYYDVLTEKGFDVQLSVPEETIHAYVNAEALYRVLDNLIANAVNHGEDGKTIGLELNTAHKGVEINVWDKGKGLEAKHQKLVFERMYSLEDSKSSSYTSSSGLGLTITKRLVEEMGGTIHLTSIPFIKTVFSIRLLHPS